MANIKNNKSRPKKMHFCASSKHFRDINISNFWPSKSRTRSRSIIFAMTPFDGKCQTYNSRPMHFCARSHRSRDIKVSNVWPSKSMSLSRTMPNLKMSYFTFFMFSQKIRPVSSKVTDRHTDAQRNGQAPIYKRNLVDLPKKTITFLGYRSTDRTPRLWHVVNNWWW